MKFKRYLFNMTAGKKDLQKKTSTLKHSYDEVSRIVQAIGSKKRP